MNSGLTNARIASRRIFELRICTHICEHICRTKRGASSVLGKGAKRDFGRPRIYDDMSGLTMRLGTML